MKSRILHSPGPVGPRRRFTPGVVLLGGVALLLALFVAALGAGWLMAKQRVRAELARIRAAGEPVSPEDLEAFYQKPPADRDTTQLWLDAIEALDTPEFLEDAHGVPFLSDTDDDELDEVLPPINEPWPQQPEVETLLVKYREALEKLHRAAQVNGAARYEVDFVGSFDMELPHVKKLYNGTRLLQLESEVAARRWEHRAVAAAIATMLIAAGSLENEPTIVSQLVRVRLDDIAEGQLERHLRDGQFSDEELLRIDRHLETIDYSASFNRAMLGERATILIYFADPNRFDTEAQGPVNALFRPADEIVYLQFMQRATAAFRESGRSFCSAIADIGCEVRQLAETSLARLRYPTSLATLPMIQAWAEVRNRAIARRDSARTAVAIERYRLQHGAPPKALDALAPELLPEVPLDPFDGKPLRYRVDEDGYRIYSVGLDGIDQGGQTSAELGDPSPDVVFRMLRSNPPLGVRRDAGVE